MRNRLRGAAAALILLAAVVGLPAALASTVGNPLHQWHALRSGDSSDTVVIAAFAAVFYLAWASFVLPLLLEVTTLTAARLTGRPQHRLHIPLLRAQHDLARGLLGALLLLAPTAASTFLAPPPAATAATDTAHDGRSHPAAAERPADVRGHGDASSVRPAHTGRYVIPQTGGLRSYWDLAQHFLGDGTRWREIWQLNAGRVHTDGTVMDSPRRLAAGWTIFLPSGATPPGDHEVTVHFGDTLSGIADADGIHDWQQVWRSNVNRPEPEGRHLSDPNFLLPGWHLRLPNNPQDVARAPAADAPIRRSVTRPAEPGAAATTRVLGQPAPEHAPATPPAAAASPTPPPPTGRSTPAQAGDHSSDPTEHQSPLPVTLEVGLGALAAVVVLDRARRIAQRRRRPGHRFPPAPPALAETERTLRRHARYANSPAAAVHLATALTGDASVSLRAVIARDDAAIDLLLTEPTAAPPPFAPIDGGWRLPADATGFTFAVDDAADPYPALAAVGRDRHGSVLIDLAAAGPVGVAGDPDQVQRYLGRLAAGLAGAPWGDRLTVHIPPTLASLVGELDRIHVDANPDPMLTATSDATAELRELGWCSAPIHVYCGYDAERASALVEAAAGARGAVVVVLNGLHPNAQTWTLDDEQLTLPNLTTPISVAVATPDDAAARITELLHHVAHSADVPLGDPQLPDYEADAPAAPDDTPTQLNILGPVELVGADQPRRSQTLNLLVYLALHRRGADRDQLATALWPDQAISNKTLRNRIHEARVLVGHAISDGPRWRLHDEVTTDWQRFTALAQGTLEEQHQALTLVRGRPFAGLDDAEWIDLEGFRSEAEATVVDLALSVAERELAAGNFEAAYSAARAGLAASRYEERLHRIAIRAAHAQGSTGKVRSQQREMRTVLDVDIEPDDHTELDTIALYDELQSERPGARTPR